MDAEEKIKLSFSKSLLKITYFQKSHTCVGCFGLFTKLRRCVELVFTAGFLYTFSIKMFLIKYPTRHSDGFVNYYLAGPQPTLGDFQRNSLTDPMVITAFSIISTWSTPGALKQVNLVTRILVRSGQNRYNAVINIGLVRIAALIISHSWL